MIHYNYEILEYIDEGALGYVTKVRDKNND
jgi:hypothetical protein